MLARLPLLVLLGAGALAVWLYPDAGSAGRQAVSPEPVRSNAAFGPGKWIQPREEEAPILVADVALSRTDEGDLLVDPALLRFFHQHFVEHAGPADREQTEQDLRGRLSGHALEQALELAREYHAYIRDYDVLLAAQNLNGVSNLARLRGWAQQRHALRQREFGNAVALAWFDNDEANLAAALDELELGATGVATEEPVTDPRYGPSELDKRHMAEVHTARLQQTLSNAVRSFTSMRQA